MYPPCSSSNEIINDEFIQTLRNDFFSDNISGSNFNFLYTEVNNSALEVCHKNFKKAQDLAKANPNNQDIQVEAQN